MPSFTEQQLREAVAEACCYTEALRLAGLRPAGGNHATIKRYVERWGIPTAHFAARRCQRGGRGAIPLEEVLVAGSTYKRSLLKTRLYEAGLKAPVCELCGRGETWHGRRMSLILDHVNGDPTDNRLMNLRIVCPNCNATLETHCGRNRAVAQNPRQATRSCVLCGGRFRPKRASQRYCSRACGVHAPPPAGPHLTLRRVERPPRARLLREIRELGYLATGRRYGVSDNAIRKWVRAYEAAEEA